MAIDNLEDKYIGRHWLLLVESEISSPTRGPGQTKYMKYPCLVTITSQAPGLFGSHSGT